LGLDVYLMDGEKNIEEASSKHPNHYCNKGYLRSSYNSAGFNSVAKELIGKDMYYIFQPIEPQYSEDEEDDEDGFYVPYSKEHLKEALLRAKEVTMELKNAPPFRSVTISASNLFSKEEKQTKASDAISTLYEAYMQKGTPYNFQSRNGHFFLQEPLEIMGAIPGVDLFGAPAVHLIVKAEDGHKYYIEQAEIMEEFIEKALSLEDPRIGWSS